MKTVLITGATSGFGLATAKLLASKGYRLILVGRRAEKLKEISQDLEVHNYIAALDVRDKAAVQKFFQDLPTEWQKIDVLVNNAGLAKCITPAQESDLDGWDEMIDTNIKGLAYMTRHTLDLMKPRNSGLIINIGSVAAFSPYKGGNVYGASKAFVKQFSRNLRTDLFGTDIKVSNIEPGIAETEFSLVRFNGDAEKAKQVYDKTRALTATDIAETILWIIERPLHVNIDNIEIMPIDQTWAGLSINRQP